MIKATWLSFVLCAVAVGGPINIVSDPSFASGTPGSYTGAMGDGWVVTAGTGAICNDITSAGCGSAGSAYIGNQMGFLDWSGTLDTTTQALTTVIGQDYTISYWVAGNAANFLEVTFGGSTLFDGTAPIGGVASPSDYVEYTFNAPATSTSTVLAFSGQRTVSGEILLGDVSVTAVPEPAPWLLTAVPLLGLGALRFKLRRG
jgi:hypothetical protein